MGSRRIANLVDDFHCRIDGCIKTNRKVRTAHIVVDGFRDSDNCSLGEPGKFDGPLQRSISAEDNEAVDFVFGKYSGSLFDSVF